MIIKNRIYFAYEGHIYFYDIIRRKCDEVTVDNYMYLPKKVKLLTKKNSSFIL